MDNYQELTASRVPDCNVPLFVNRVVGITESRGQWIVENGDCFVKRYMVFPKIALSLLAIPLKLHVKFYLNIKAASNPVGDSDWRAGGLYKALHSRMARR